MQFLEQVPLAPYTTFQIGGPARWFAEAASEDDIAAGVAFAGQHHLPLFILGRGSNFNSTERERYVVTRVDYSLRKNGPASIIYADLARYFAARNGAAPSLAEVREAVRSIRAQKGMLLVSGDADCRSAGSFFKNPGVPVTVLDSLAQELGIGRESIPAYPAPES